MGAPSELLDAADAGDLPRVRALVRSGEDVDAADAVGETALIRAAWGGYLAVVRFLVESGAHLDARDDVLSETALMHAAVGGHADVVRFLALAGSDLNAVDRVGGRTALMLAAFEGHVDVVRCLAELGADLDATDRARQTALLVATKKDRLEVVQCLAMLGADINAVNSKGQTALRVAANRGNYEVQRALTRFVALTPPQIRAMTAPGASFSASRAASWFIPPSEVELLHFVDSGSIGGDFRAKWLDADAVVKLFIADASHSSFADEVRLWQQLRHPNIIKLYGACDAGLHLRFFVCESASSGSLAEYTQARTADERAVWMLLYEAALSLEYLHERNVVHGGLRCSNILIGDDGRSKLANFELSQSTRAVESTSAHAPVGSVRWQSPERLRGEPGSLASDVYSLGMCILEAVTGKVPWADDDDAWVKHYRKNYWDPVDESASNNQPGDIGGSARSLVWRMCGQTPDKRASLSQVLYELERLSSTESLGLEAFAMEEFQGGSLIKAWARVQSLMSESTGPLHRLAFEELQELQERIRAAPRSREVLERFHHVLMDFQQIVTVSTRQDRVMRLSATRASNHSLHAFHRRVQVLWGTVNDSVHAASQREARWIEQRRQQIELFVSEVSKRWLLLGKLESAEQKLGFLSFLQSEMDTRGACYTPGQLEVMRKAYRDTVKLLTSTQAASAIPPWFIPWYELHLDPWSCLGTGGFGSVYRAKWLDSDVVVKEVSLAGPAGRSTGGVPSFASESTTDSIPETPTSKLKRAAALEMFQHEANIWFGLSHPHVVRLFGACHIGRPFFICEYATKGTLVSYIRAHPDQAWSKLLEAALGVQYLHARGIIHGDLKGNNIVIGADDKAKVTDFGLSSGVNNDDEANTWVSGASHWLAPEVCGGGRPTFESDIFSLGMCIVEAMRVVEGVQRGKDARAFPPLPWGTLDNAVVEFHVKNGTLPMRPETCSDEQWRLVERMSAFHPDQRVKISTVVDELVKLVPTSTSVSGHNAVRESDELRDSILTRALWDPDAALAIVPAMRQLLGRVKSGPRTTDAHEWLLYPIYELLWDRIALIQRRIRDYGDPKRVADLNALVAGARVSTNMLQHDGNTLLQLTEATLRGLALHRRLDKFIDATFLPATEQDVLLFCDWKARCCELHRPPPTRARRETPSPVTREVEQVDTAGWRCCRVR